MFVRAINYSLPWLFILLVLSIVIAGVARRQWLLITLIIPSIAICMTLIPLFLPHNNIPLPNDKVSLKVMSHNLFFRLDTQAMFNVIRQQQPDVLLLQEVHPDLVSLALDDLADLYPDLYVDIVDQPEKTFVHAILSRYPVTRIGAEFDQGRIQKARVDTPDGPIVIWNAHFIPPHGIGVTWHTDHINALEAELSTIEEPLILAGDLNVTAQSTTYQIIDQYLNEAHQHAGWGFGFTFPAPPHGIKRIPISIGLLYRIDHIFYSNHFIAHKAQTVANAAGSDHLPVTATLSFSN